MTDAGRRARCGYRCGDEAATRDSEHARPRYAWSGSADIEAVVTAFVLAATLASVSAGSVGRTESSPMGGVRACGDEQVRDPARVETRIDATRGCAARAEAPAPQRASAVPALQVLVVEVGQLGGDGQHVIVLVVQVDVRGALDDQKLFWLCRPLVGVLAEVERVRFGAGDQQEGRGEMAWMPANGKNAICSAYVVNTNSVIARSFAAIWV